MKLLAYKIRTFIRWRVYPWSVINELRGQSNRANERVEQLKEAIREWRKTGDTEHLNAIADGAAAECIYNLKRLACKSNPLWDAIKTAP